MKRIILLIFVIAISLTGCSKEGFLPGPKGDVGPQGDIGPSSSDFAEDAIEIKKSDDLVTEEYPFIGFSQLEIGLFGVKVRVGESYHVVLEMDKNLFEYVQVTQQGESLRIGLDPSNAYHMESIHMRAEVSLPRLTRLTMDLSDDGEIISFKSEDELVINMSNSSLRGEIHSGDLEITAEVDTSIKLSGSAADITVKAAVDSIVDLSELECHNAVVAAEVGSQVIVFLSDRLDAEASASEVWYLGDSNLGEISTELGGSVQKQ